MLENIQNTHLNNEVFCVDIDVFLGNLLIGTDIKHV